MLFKLGSVLIITFKLFFLNKLVNAINGWINSYDCIKKVIIYMIKLCGSIKSILENYVGQ